MVYASLKAKTQVNNDDEESTNI